MKESKGTFCPRLWDSVAIDYNGNVYSCCMRNPALMGNIYNQRLEDIINNDIIREQRMKALNGELGCYNECKNSGSTMGVYISNPPDMVDYKSIRKLKITYGFGCNINCIMCLKDDRSNQTLDYEKVKQNVNLTKFKDGVVIQGGEPLIHKETKNFFDYVVSLGQRVSFITNGLLIDDEWAEKIALHSKQIQISLNAATKETHEIVNRGSRWENVLENIQKLQEYKSKTGSKLLIIGHMTLVEQNLSEIPLFIKNRNKFGVDQIKFGYENKIPAYLRNNPDLRKSLIDDVKKELFQIKDDRVQVIAWNLEVLEKESKP